MYIYTIIYSLYNHFTAFLYRLQVFIPYEYKNIKIISIVKLYCRLAMHISKNSSTI